MRRSLAALLVGSMLWVLAAAAPVPRDTNKSKLFFPTEVGTKLVKRYYDTGSSSDSTYAVTAVEEKGAAKLVTISWTTQGLSGLVNGKPYQSPDREDLYAKYLVSKNGLFVVSDYNLIEKKWQDFDHPRCLLKLPVKPGDSWTTEVPAERYKVTATVGKPERVKVPAGTFDAIPVHADATHNGKPVPHRTVWYAAGIGPIKSMVGDRVGMELVSFTPGKAAK